MKPHEETWAEHPSNTSHLPDRWVVSHNGEGPVVVTVHGASPERTALVVAAPAMARALLAHVKSCSPCRGRGRVPVRNLGLVPCEACALDRVTLKEAGVLE